MSPFLGTHQNRLDAKGRVSIPASFRTLLKEEWVAAGVILRPSHKHACIEVWPAPAFDALAKPLESMDLFSEDHDDMALSLYADAYPVNPDKEGRIMLPETLTAHANLSDAATFVGAGRIFQIWEPAAAEIEKQAARERARAKGVLRAVPVAAGA
jgi:MraZ protein